MYKIKAVPRRRSDAEFMKWDSEANAILDDDDDDDEGNIQILF